MYLQLPASSAEKYKSPQQQARAVTEGWGAANLYCANCDSDHLDRLRANTPAIDFVCPQCGSLFQLKGRKEPIRNRLADAAYRTMRDAILCDRTPNLLGLHYDPSRWLVENLILIPRFTLSLSALKRRKPLGPNAERRGWVGCDILLGSIPPDGRIALVHDCMVVDPLEVRRQYQRLRPLAQLTPENRGWTLDVLNVVRSLGKAEFNLPEVYAFEGQLARLHPRNHRIPQKIRQQLQILRDKGFLDFVGPGEYRLC